MDIYELAAIRTEEMMMVRFERARKLVPLFPAEWDGFGNAELYKQLDGSINTYSVYLWATLC